MGKDFPHIFFLLMVLMVSAAFAGLISEFMMALFWAVILTILFYKTFDRIKTRFRGKENLAASLTLLIIIFIVIVPVLLIGSALVRESIFYYDKVSSGEIDLGITFDEIRSSIPINSGLLVEYGLDMDKIRSAVDELLTSGSQVAAAQAFAFTQDFFSFFLEFAVMLYVLYFFLRDGKKIIDGVIWVLPIGDEKERALIRRFESVARATVKGSLLVAMLQGTIGGLLFWVLDIPAAMLWGVVMIFLSLLPVGSTVIWLPAALIYIFQGAITKGMIIIIVGSLVIGLMDNLLRPRLVGKDTKMPDYLILISTLGGISWFGLSGFVIGPIIAALFLTCWQMMGREFGN